MNQIPFGHNFYVYLAYYQSCSSVQREITEDWVLICAELHMIMKTRLSLDAFTPLGTFSSMNSDFWERKDSFRWCGFQPLTSLCFYFHYKADNAAVRDENQYVKAIETSCIGKCSLSCVFKHVHVRSISHPWGSQMQVV